MSVSSLCNLHDRRQVVLHDRAWTVQRIVLGMPTAVVRRLMVFAHGHHMSLCRALYAAAKYNAVPGITVEIAKDPR